MNEFWVAGVFIFGQLFYWWVLVLIWCALAMVTTMTDQDAGQRIGERPETVGDLLLYLIISGPGLALLTIAGICMGIGWICSIKLQPPPKVCPYCKTSDCYGIKSKCVKGVKVA